MTQPHVKTMFTLLGEFSVSGNGLEAWLRKHHFGRMWARDPMKFECESELCGFDNGAWSCFAKGTSFDEARFERRLEQALDALGGKYNRCICAVCPDIVAGGMRSLDFSMSWIDRLPDELPWHLAVQDEMDATAVGQVIHKFAGLFLGGSDEFKKTADFWCQFAHDEGKLFHWGRCRSINNVREALLIGADSIDSTRPVRAWVSGERSRAKQWLKVASGRDNQMHFLS